MRLLARLLLKMALLPRAVRIYAVGRLVDSRRPSDVELLLLQLESSEQSVRNAARRSLQSIGPVAVSHLIPHLSAADLRVRIAVAVVLGGYGREAAEAVPALVDRLADEDARVRLAAAKAVGAIGPAAPDAAAALVRLLTDPNGTIQAAAARALGPLGSTAQETIPILIDRLSAPERTVRESAAAALGRIGPAVREFLPVLIQRLFHASMPTPMCVKPPPGHWAGWDRPPPPPSSP